MKSNLRDEMGNSEDWVVWVHVQRARGLGVPKGVQRHRFPCVELSYDGESKMTSISGSGDTAAWMENFVFDVKHRELRIAQEGIVTTPLKVP